MRYAILVSAVLLAGCKTDYFERKEACRRDGGILMQVNNEEACVRVEILREQKAHP